MLTVVAAIIYREGRILITRRPADAHLGGLWEFPGGKVEPGESLPAALVREIREELDVEISVGNEIFSTEHCYPTKTVSLHFFECQLIEGDPRPVQVDAIAWVDPLKLHDFSFPDADRGLIKLLTESKSVK